MEVCLYVGAIPAFYHKVMASFASNIGRGCYNLGLRRGSNGLKFVVHTSLF